MNGQLMYGGAAAFRFWFLPSRLGLDAPCVVSTWTWALARSASVPLLGRALAALFFTVWAIYLLDRLIDVARCQDWSRVSGRMHFGRANRPLFLACLTACLLVLGTLLITGLPHEVLLRGGAVAAGMVLYFLLYVMPLVLGWKLRGKEFGVGLFFALGAWAVLGYQPGTLWMFVSIALVVAFNCLVIAARDAETDRANDPSGAAAWWPNLARRLPWIGGALLAYELIAALFAHSAFHLAAAAAVFLLLLLHRRAPRLSDDAVRALADFCLFTPWIAIPLAETLHG